MDVAGSQYWLGDEGPYKLGMATTAFLAGDEDEAAAERDKALRKLHGNRVRRAIAEEIFREQRERLNRK